MLLNHLQSWSIRFIEASLQRFARLLVAKLPAPPIIYIVYIIFGVEPLPVNYHENMLCNSLSGNFLNAGM